MSDLRGFHFWSVEDGSVKKTYEFFLHESIEQNIIVKGCMSDIRGFLTLKTFLVDLRGFLIAPGGNNMHFRVMRSSPSVSSIFFIIETTSISFSEKSRLTRFLNQSVDIRNMTKTWSNIKERRNMKEIGRKYDKICPIRAHNYIGGEFRIFPSHISYI